MVGVALKDTTPDALIELVLALEQIVLEADESLFEFNSEKLDQIVRGLLEQFGFGDASSTPAVQIHEIAVERLSWLDNTTRWSALLLKVDAHYTTGKARDGSTKSEEKEEEPTGDSESGGSEASGAEETDEDEDSGTGGIVIRIGKEFGFREKVEVWRKDILPTIRVIGPIYSLFVKLYDLLAYCWGMFVNLLVTIGEFLDFENNVFVALHWVSKLWKPLGFIVRVFATIIDYIHWIIMALVIPIIRFLQDPAGRSMKFFKSKMKEKKGDGDSDDSDAAEDAELQPSN